MKSWVVIFDPWIVPLLVLPHHMKENLRIMTIKGLSTLHKLQDRNLTIRCSLWMKGSCCNFSEKSLVKTDVKDIRKEWNKTRLDWMRKMELWKKFKFDPKNKWFMHNLRSILENETNNILWDFKIQTDHRISAGRPDLVIVKKKENLLNSRFAVPAEHRLKL